MAEYLILCWRVAGCTLRDSLNKGTCSLRAFRTAIVSALSFSMVTGSYLTKVGGCLHNYSLDSHRREQPSPTGSVRPTPHMTRASLVYLLFRIGPFGQKPSETHPGTQTSVKRPESRRGNVHRQWKPTNERARLRHLHHLSQWYIYIYSQDTLLHRAT